VSNGEDSTTQTFDFSEATISSEGSAWVWNLDVPPDIDRLELVSVVSPRSLHGVPGPPESPELVEAEFADRLDIVVKGDRTLEQIDIHIADDSVLNLRARTNSAVLHSDDWDRAVSLDCWLSTTVVLDGPVLGVARGRVENGEVLLFEPTPANVFNDVEMRGTPDRPQFGAVGIRNLAIPDGATKLDLGRPAITGEWVGRPSLSVHQFAGLTRGIRLKTDRDLSVGSLPEGSCVEVQKVGTQLTLGGISAVEFCDLEVVGGSVSILDGVVDGLTLTDVDVLTLGQSELKNEETAIVEETSWETSATITRARGSLTAISLSPDSLLSAAPNAYVQAATVEMCSDADVLGLDALSLPTASILRLSDARLLALFVGTATEARKRVRKMIKQSDNKDVGLSRLADRFGHLERLAVSSDQSGHVRSVIREVERDVRRRTLPLWNRERVLLAISRVATGYGQRIWRPLWVGLSIITVLLSLEIGSTRLSSKAWWEQTLTEERLMSLAEFTLPGLSLLGLESYPGLLGIIAKLVSVLTFAASIGAGRRLMSRA
jgi:hypothetical protein